MVQSYNTRQISLKHYTETKDFSSHVFSTNLFNFFPSVLFLFLLNIEIRVYLKKGGYVYQH